MKILKIFGVVVGIHLFALILIFANPGCSSTKPPPAPADTALKADQAPGQAGVSAPAAADLSPVSVAPVSGPSSVSFDPNAAAGGGATVRYTPTRPNTPAATQLEAEPVADVTPATTYSVAKGDSLWTIAKKHKLSVTELAAANNIKPSSTVHLGQKLIIPSKALPAGTSAGHNAVDKTATKSTPTNATSAPDSASRASGELRHVVKPGETLGAIAHKYHVKMGDISVANNITDPKKIRPGMELKIPGASGSSAPAKSSTTARTPSPVSSAPADSPVQPAPNQDLDAGLKSKSNEPLEIKIDDGSGPQKM